MSSSLPEGFRVRPVTPADTPAINELVVAADVAVQGFSDSTEADVQDWWRQVDLESDTWLIANHAAAAFGAAEAHGEDAQLDGYVHPELKGRGLGSWLLTRGEQWARENNLAALRTWSLGTDAGARTLFEGRGYGEVRRYYRMLIELQEPPPPPEWPEGFTVETHEPEVARAFYQALNEAFEDEWHFVPTSFEEWTERRLHAPSFDPTLWFIVREGDGIAAILRADPEVEQAGWVGALGVLKPWRRRGLGLALLRHAFGEFYRRGQPRIALGVDAENTSGATRLYERAGMHLAWEAVCFRRELSRQ
jgi:mycothiol synthase